MKSGFLILSFLFSLQTFAATLFINSPEQNAVIRDKNGKVDIEGVVDFGANPPNGGNRGKVTCGNRQGPVKPDFSWKINNLSLETEGINSVTTT